MQEERAQKPTTLYSARSQSTVPLFFDSKQARISDVKSLLQPITAVLESVMKASFNSQQSHELPSEILDLLKHIAQALTNPSACPCFQMQLLNLLKHSIVDQKDPQVAQVIA